MKLSWLSVLILGCAGSMVHAQPWPGYPYRPAYYYGGQPTTTPYYYYPQPSMNYYQAAPPMPTYTAPPTYYAPTPAPLPSNRSTAYAPPTQPVPREIVIQNQSAGGEAGETLSVSPRPTLLKTPSENPDGSNAARFWSQLSERVRIPDHWLRPAEGEKPRTEVCWVSGSYLAAFFRPMRLNGPLVTTGSVLDNVPGGLGSPSTSVLFGKDAVNSNLASGATFTAGKYLDDERRLSLEGTIFFAIPEQTGANFASSANGDPLLARPVFATDLGREAVFFSSLPGALAGNVNVNFRSVLGGAEVNGRYNFGCGGRLQSDVLLGARYAILAERMQIQENLTAINGNVIGFNGQNFTGLSNNDSFATRNQFIGGQLGGRVSYEHPWFSLSLFAKLGLGATVQQVDIDGSTTFVSPTSSLTAAGGVLALPSNIRTYERTSFGILPELGFNMGINVTETVRLQMGYSALLWSGVVRPGTSYDHAVNTGLAPGSQNFGVVTGAVAPQFRLRDETFWAHALRFGVEVRY